MDEEQVAISDIDHLLSFIPRLRRLNGRYTTGWKGGETDSDGVTTLPWPVYRKAVKEFFRAAGQEPWSDRDYDPGRAGRMLVDREKVMRLASLQEIRTMLTFCVRGERFCDGHWEKVLQDGSVFDLLERLREIRISGEKGKERK